MPLCSLLAVYMGYAVRVSGLAASRSLVRGVMRPRLACCRSLRFASSCRDARQFVIVRCAFAGHLRSIRTYGAVHLCAHSVAPSYSNQTIALHTFSSTKIIVRSKCRRCQVKRSFAAFFWALDGAVGICEHSARYH